MAFVTFCNMLVIDVFFLLQKSQQDTLPRSLYNEFSHIWVQISYIYHNLSEGFYLFKNALHYAIER